MKIVCLLSGGIDSTILLFRLSKNRHDLIPLFVDYGQKASKMEFQAASLACKLLKLKLEKITIPGLSKISSGLTSKTISHIKNPIFPNRNLLLLLIASAFASTKKCNVISIGIVGGTDFADQSKKFVKDAESTLSYGRKIIILAPLIELNKLEVVRIAKENNIPLEFTYSCYSGSKNHCRRCLSCIDRFKVFAMEDLLNT